LPCNVFKTFATGFDIKYLKANYALVVVALSAIVVFGVLAFFGSKLFSRDNYERCVFEYSLAIPNSGYMGYPLAEALLGAAGLLDMMLFAIPIQFYIYTYGYARLTKRRLAPKKLVNSVTVAMVLGVVFGLSPLTLPEIPLTFLTNASACMGPVSMLLAGIAISEFGIAPMFLEKRSYILSIFRLVVAPLAVGGMAYLVFGREVGAVAALYFAMPCGLNSIVFPKAVGEPCRSGASLVFVSTVLSCITIPAVLFLFGIGA
jgi:predicted permease